MAEAKDSTFGFLFTHRFLLEKMEKPQHGGVTHSFVTENRRLALFTLRMRESIEKHDRLAVVAQLGEIIDASGFETEIVGGLYFLQGQISEHVTSSLVTGVGQLLLGFLVVAALVSRSLRASAALAASLCLVAGMILGLLGYFRVPLDIISSPAVNIALSMAVDDMLHMSELARELRRNGAGRWEAWARARALSWKPLLGTAAIVCAGFSIFLLSSFPPTRRFGLAVLLGAVVDVLACLIVLPFLAGAPLGKLFRVWTPRSRHSRHQ
jgi:predicted RND superfamily exporter protein